jgi:nucleotide-binding universal stress UspA family protein
MGLKHLIVHVDSSERSSERLKVAVKLATRHGARLTGLFAETSSLGASVVARRSPQNMAKAMEEARARFEADAAAAGLSTDWWQVEQGDYGQVVGWTVVCCRYGDVAIFGQHDPEHGSTLPHDLVDQVLLNSGRPLLVVPYVGSYEEVGRRVLVAWTGSRESARAVNDAIPFMQQAQEVTVVSLQHPTAGPLPGTLPPVDIAAHLRAHGIEAQYERILVDEIGAVDNVLNRAAESSADLTVLGGYGHSGFPFLQRSTTTRDILRTMTTPVLLSR